MKNKLIKGITLVGVIATMAMGLAGCGAKEDVYDTVKEAGVLKVGMSADYAPYEYHAIIDGKDEVVGFDVDIAKQLAKDLEVELEIVEMEFGSLVTSVKQGKIDMVISGMTPTDERKKEVDFTDIYYTADQTFLIKDADKDTYTTLSDLEGKKVGAQLGTIQADMANEIKDAEVKLLADVGVLLLELESGNLDAVIVEYPVASMAALKNDKLFVPDERIEDGTGGSAIAIAKESPKFLEEVNKSLKTMMDADKIKAFEEKALEQVKYQVEEE